MKASKTQATSCIALIVCIVKPHITFLAKATMCPECGAKMEYAGPLWIGSISDSTFIEQIIKENQKTAFKNSAKITKLLTLSKNEATAPDTYYVIDKLSGKLNLPAPSNPSSSYLL